MFLYCGAGIWGWKNTTGLPRVLIGLFLAPMVPFLLYRLYGWLLLLVGAMTWRQGDVRGLLVYSNSPHWQDYIEEKWLPRVGHHLRVLNWSERRRWARSLETRLFSHYVGTAHNFNPSVLVLRGMRRPLVFRFFYAFRDAKHGNQRALRRLEGRLFEELA